MENILVSIIVPVYNVEHYIEQCVNSLQNQEHFNIEIILVDDGSKDGSGAILDQLAEQDNRIRVIHKENGGVSSARNAGLDVAQGEYILFVDGDDYVDREYVSYFLRLVMDNHCDIAMNATNYTYKTIETAAVSTDKVISALQAMEYIYTGKIFVAVWNKIYKRSFLEKYKIRFDTDYWYGEGMLFNIACLQYVEQVVLGDRNVYHQIYNPGSAMRSFNLKSNYCGMRSMEKQKELWKKKNRTVEDAWHYHYRCFYSVILCGLIKTGQVKEYRNVFKKCVKELHKNVFLPLKVDIGLKEKVSGVLTGFFPVLIATRSARKDLALAKKYRK